MRSLLLRGACALSLAAPLLLGGCNLLVDPDEGRLRGRADAGDIPFDAPIGVDVPTGVDAPGCAIGCDDGVECTIDRCISGDCTHDPIDSTCAEAERCHPIRGCIPELCRNDDDCDDARFCNGVESCNPRHPLADADTGCVAGMAPDCADTYACTTDSCSDSEGRCVSAPDHEACNDSVACTVDTCAPTMEGADDRGCVVRADDLRCAGSVCGNMTTCDVERGCVLDPAPSCDDANPCTHDFCSVAIGGCTHPLLDEDGDGFGTQSADERRCAGDDCNDEHPDVFPGAPELCNSMDDDCDGVVDEDCTFVGDDCAHAVRLPLDRSGMATARGNLGSFSHHFSTTCGDTGEIGRDVVFFVDLPRPSDVEISTEGSRADTVLAVTASCGPSALGPYCNDDAHEGETWSRIFMHRVGGRTLLGAPTRLYIIVDGWDADATQAFTLSVSARPATEDLCSDGIDISGGGTLIGVATQDLLRSGQSGSCQVGGLATRPIAEGVARIADPVEGARIRALSQDFTPDLYLRSNDDPDGSCSSDNERECARGTFMVGQPFQSVDLVIDNPGGDKTFIFIDGANGPGRYILRYYPPDGL